MPCFSTCEILTDFVHERICKSTNSWLMNTEMMTFQLLVFLDSIFFLFYLFFFIKILLFYPWLFSYLLYSPYGTWTYDLTSSAMSIMKEELTWSRHFLLVLFLHAIRETMKFYINFRWNVQTIAVGLFLFFFNSYRNTIFPWFPPISFSQFPLCYHSPS